MTDYLICHRPNRKKAIGNHTRTRVCDEIAGKLQHMVAMSPCGYSRLWSSVLVLAVKDLFDAKCMYGEVYSTSDAIDAYHYLFGRQGKITMEHLGIDVDNARAMLERECLINHNFREHPNTEHPGSEGSERVARSERSFARGEQAARAGLSPQDNPTGADNDQRMWWSGYCSCLDLPQIIEAEEAGKQAREAGGTLDANPYPKDSGYAYLWSRGWGKARRAREAA